MGMTNREKIDRLFSQFTQRYGELDLKTGQSLEAVRASWVRSVGRYEADAIKAAMVTVFANTKYTRWPEEGQFIDILRGMGCLPETAPEADARPYEIKQAESDAGRWYWSIITARAPDYAFPFTLEMAVHHIIGAGERQNSGKKLPQLLTDAWLRGDIPNGFEVKTRAYFAEMQGRKQKYWAAVKEHGHVAVNERRVQFMNQ
jgi:hypothetical protein